MATSSLTSSCRQNVAGRGKRRREKGKGTGDRKRKKPRSDFI
jgi:hypothetical protein